ncbi:MAG: metallophosphoesterase family protein, partial [Planctomycetota bacterium]
MRAIISDIHGNLEAFQAVLEDMERQGATEVV